MGNFSEYVTMLSIIMLVVIEVSGIFICGVFVYYAVKVIDNLISYIKNESRR